MDDEVQKLVLEPFQDLIEKGNTALENATDANATEMLKAAQSLVKMGGLALKKIEPLCKKYWEDYSTNFVIALKENSESITFISSVRGSAHTRQVKLPNTGLSSTIYSGTSKPCPSTRLRTLMPASTPSCGPSRAGPPRRYMRY